MIVFSLTWVNCNMFSVYTFLGVGSVEEKQIYIVLAFFSNHFQCIKIGVIQSVHNQYLLELGKNNLCFCCEPAASGVNVGSILPWEDLHGCDVPLPHQTTSSQCRARADANIVCVGFVIQFCFSVLCTVLEECSHFLKLLFCWNLSLEEPCCVHLVKK